MPPWRQLRRNELHVTDGTRGKLATMTRAQRGTCRPNLSIAGKDPPILPSEGRTQRSRVHPHPMPFPGPASLCSVPSCMKPSSLQILQTQWILPQWEWQASCPDPTKFLTAFTSIFHSQSLSPFKTQLRSLRVSIWSLLSTFSARFLFTFHSFFSQKSRWN